ncbi:TonB-dependent siderophore receptor [Pseudomonas sp. M47T1]|uniref:TonB-dependent siderophore receptor n=1 Tax=Pseudomonas sp. M47T1 TaxID=1179778 RepID=UPI00026078E7|nr:TonB-dependent siderophore receptor [Pseudomonas sp. M47T1]EIK94635.1 TonB-dependent siderophore receptor [Pseudomonas sp. M47T1]
MFRPLPFPARLLVSSIALASGWATAEEPLTLGTVTVVGDSPDSYRATHASVTGTDDAPLLDTPAAVSVFNTQLLQDQQARLLSEVLRNDASVGDSYAPVGYYENFVIRGFSLNAASSYKINGRTITGEQNVALENKEQVEVLKGLAGLQSGVSEPGGVINYETKRPTEVKSVTVSTDEQGGRYLATDLGTWFGSEQQFGIRTNLAHEDLRSYVDHADGTRDFGSVAFDWNIDPRSSLQLDVEYQHREQRSVPGYQLLGGTEVPHHADPHDLLGYQSWSNPVGITSLNMEGRYQYRLTDDWKAQLSLSRSRVIIDDYSAFPWACYGTASCANDPVPNHFSSTGDYDIYDFRSPDDTRRNDEAEAWLSGEFSTFGLRNELDVGLSAFRRTVDQRDAINEYVGSGNIDATPPTYTPYQGAENHTYRHLDSRQYGLFVNDRLHLNEQWQLVLGGREVRLDEKAFDADGDTTRHTQMWEFLPNLAVIYKPTDNLSLYTRYSKGLSLGSEAAWFTTNANETLAPTISRQLELGIKQDWQRLSLGAALFQITQAYQFSRPNGDGTFTYVQQGKQKNIGLELTASGRASDNLQLNASVAATRARVTDTGIDAYEGHQAINVPRLRASFYGDYSVPGIDGLALLGGVQYSGKKYANREGTVQVGDYAVFNAGSRYTTRLEGYETVLRLSVDNLFDKRYWRDVGEFAGDDYLFLGAPRTARLSATVNF